MCSGTGRPSRARPSPTSATIRARRRRRASSGWTSTCATSHPERDVGCVHRAELGPHRDEILAYMRDIELTRARQQLFQRHAARLLVQERLVGGVLQQPPHEVRHAGHEVADRAVGAHAQALGGDRGLQRVAEPAQDLQLEVLRRRRRSAGCRRSRARSSAGCARRSRPGAPAARRAAAASASRSSRRCRPCARTPARTSRAARPGRARGPSRRP